MNNKNLNENILGWIELGLLTAQLAMGLGHIKFSVKNFLSDRKKRKQIEQLILKLNKTNPELVQKLKTLKPSEPVPSDISSEIKSSLSPEELQLFDTIQESKTNMDQTTQLRQLIRESIQEYIREVETSGNIAAQEAKIKACEEAIALREKKVNMEGLDEAYHDMMDSSKLNELKKEVKELQKYKAKAEKLLEKMKAKAEGKMAPKKMEDEGMNEETEEGMVDEVNLDEYTSDPAAGPELEEARFKKGTDIGKKGKGFAKIAKSAAKEYGSKEAGQRVAGAILKKVLKKEEVETEGETLNESFLHMQKLAGLITEAEYKQKLDENK